MRIPRRPTGAPRDAKSPSFRQFLGPNRDATLRGSGPRPRLAERGAGRALAAAHRPGWSGFAVANGLAVTLEQRDGKERVVAYDLERGSVRWSHGGGAGFESVMAGDGPRATPAIDGGRVYAFGVNGVLTALDLASGRLLFEKDVLAENGARRPEHGVASSPLVVDGVVVVQAGGSGGRSLVAYDARTGERRWSGGDDPAAYSSPRVATLGGVRQVVVLLPGQPRRARRPHGRRPLAGSLARARGEGVTARRPGRRPRLRVGGRTGWAGGW